MKNDLDAFHTVDILTVSTIDNLGRVGQGIAHVTAVHGGLNL
jgi:hypothetical protein